MPERVGNLDPTESVAALEEHLSKPSPELVEMMSRVRGDIIVLGVAGKMGPTLARMAQRASLAAGTSRRIIGVARFSKPEVCRCLEEQGVETIRGDLLEPDTINALPDAPNVVFAAGMKFGAAANEPLTWAMNTHLPSLICDRYAASRIIAFSTGNVYGPASARGGGGGSVETDRPNPVGEYAMSCLGRERMFQFFSARRGTPVAVIRLNYAVELRYGVLIDLAQRVWSNEPIDLTMGYANVIWQADANALALRLFEHTTSPAAIFNLAGPEVFSVRRVCERFAELFSRSPRFVGSEAPDALLSNGHRLYGLLGRPSVSVEQMIRWTAQWVRTGGETLGKPTHFEVRDGKF